MIREIKPPKSSLRNNIMVVFSLVIIIWGIGINSLFQHVLQTTLVQEGLDKTVIEHIARHFTTISTGLTIAGIFLVLFIAVFLSKSITKPIEQLTGGVMEVARGNLDVRIDIRSQDEIGQLAEGFNRMVTERKLAEEKIRKLSRAVEQSPAMVVITDTEGRIEYVNPKFTQLTGYSPEEVIGENPRILKSGETPPEVYKELWDTITSGGEWRGEFHNKKKNGELYWEFASISPITNEEGVITHFLALKEDITERKRLEEETLRAKDETIRQMKHHREYVLDVADGLRNPLQMFMGLLEDFDTSNFTEEQKRRFKDILEASRRVEENIKRLTRREDEE